MKQARHLTFRVFTIILLLFIFTIVSDSDNGAQPFEPDVASAQGGSDPDDKQTSIDFYPDPAAAGALPFSLRDPWDKTDLTYYFHNCPAKEDCLEAKEAIRRAFLPWANASALTFTEVNSANAADIEIQWVGANSDPLGELGEVGGTLAYAYFPRYGGDMFIDDAEPWTIGDRGEFDLELTAIHEIGHAIGLGHSEFTSAIMYPYAGFATDLGADDLAAIQSLYGPPSGTTPATSDNDVDSNDTDDTTTNVIPNVASGSVDGNISNGDPYEVWEFEANADDTIVITMTATSGLDPYVGLLDSDLSTVLAENDDLAIGNQNSQIVYTFEESGLYNIVATRYGFEDGETTGSYTLSFETNPNDVASDDGSSGGNDEDTEVIDATVIWRVTNFADTDLCHVYFSDSGGEDWGPDQLDGQPLADNFFFSWEVPAGNYDIQVWDCFGNKLERYNIQARRNVDIQIFFDSIEIFPLVENSNTPPPSEPASVTWRVTNYAGVELCSVQFSPTTSDVWGPDQLSNETQLPNTYREWQLEPDQYDIRVEDCATGFLEEYDITVRGNVEVQIYADMILVVPLN